MKLCFIADATAIHTRRWVEYFSKGGHEVHLITYEPPDKPIHGIHLHVVNSRFSNLYLSFPFRHIRIMRIVKQIKPDIVHAHFISKFGFHGALLGFHPLVMSAWGSDVLVIPYWSKLLWYFTGFCLKRADRIYAVSGDISNKIISNFTISAEDVKVVPFGVDIDLFYPVIKDQKILNEKVVVLSNRNFIEVYNIETLINAIPVVIKNNKNIHFMIKGTGPQENSLKELAHHLKIDDYVTFIGWTEYKDMPKYLHDCDVYVSTALSDGTPVSVLEAMACQKACIVTDVGGVSEWIEDDVNGCLIPPRQPHILAQNILKLANDPVKRERIGKLAYNTIKKKGNWEDIMKGIMGDYELLVTGYGKK